MRWQVGILRVCGVALLLLGATSAGAEDEIVRGGELAKRWCADCHVIAPNGPGGDAGPPFVSVADRIGQTEGELQVWLADPHPPMPDPVLAAPEYRALAAYIMSLKP